MHTQTFFSSWRRAHLAFFALVGAVLLPAIFGGGLDSFGRGFLFVISALFVVFQYSDFPKENRYVISSIFVHSFSG